MLVHVFIQLYTNAAILSPGNASMSYLAAHYKAPTCCSLIDLTPDMTTTPFLRCLKKFSAKRGVPSTLVSDNCCTFKN